MVAEQFEQLSKKQLSNYPLSAEELITYMFSVEAETYMFLKPPERVSDLVEYYTQHGAEVTAIYHPEYGWFILKKPNIIVAWWLNI